MRRVLGYALRYKMLYIIPIAAMLIAVALDMYNPVIIKIIIDDVILGGNLEIFNSLLLAFLGITIGRSVFGYIRQFLFDYAGAAVSMDIRNDLFAHIQKLPFDYFDGVNTGEIMSRTTEDINNIWGAMGFAIVFFLEQVLYFTIASYMLFTIDWRLAIVTLLAMPPMLLAALRLEKLIRAAFGNLSDQNAELNTAAQENLAGVRLVKAFGRERYEISKFLKENDKHFKLNVEQATVWAKYHPLIEFLSSLAMVIVISIGGMFVVGNRITLGDLVKFNGYVMMLIWPMRLMGWLTNLLARCSASAKRIFDIMDIEPGISSPENAVVPKEFKGNIVFENVSFKYNDDYVLKNVNINVPAGSTVAIMGTTGSGKSSIINLIGRYYDCTEGRILIDGIDVRDMDLKALRENISVVMQDTFLFSDTIRENITFSVDSVTKDEFMRAVYDAQVDEFVKDMGEGYETVIGERGVGLSGGQKQRISIARAMLKQSKVLILDDATSSLDMETEYKIQKALERHRKMTKFVIAHRVSAVKNADEILIVENGKIIERGNHYSLLRKKGKYHEIYREQFKDIDGLEEEVI